MCDGAAAVCFLTAAVFLSGCSEFATIEAACAQAIVDPTIRSVTVSDAFGVQVLCRVRRRGEE